MKEIAFDKQPTTGKWCHITSLKREIQYDSSDIKWEREIKKNLHYQ